MILLTGNFASQAARVGRLTCHENCSNERGGARVVVIQEPLLVTLSLQIFYSDCLWSIFWYFLQLLRLLCCLFDIKLQYYGLYLDFRAFVATKKFQYRIYGDIHLSHHLWKHINVVRPFNFFCDVYIIQKLNPTE